MTRSPAPLPKGPDRFEAWLRAPILPGAPPHPQLEMSRATPAEFEEIFDLVDAIFGVRRPRALYDWLYRRNPRGRARCWLVRERATGRLVGTGAHWPWPLARGGEGLDGTLAGDVGVARDWRGRGVAELRREVRIRHPMLREGVGIGWANPHTVARSQRYGRAEEILGPLPEVSLRLGPPRSWLASLRRLGGGPHGDLRVEAIARFDAAFDRVTGGAMASRGLWCPHDAEFLGWRYLAHPTRSYRALAAVRDEAPEGYAVVRLEGRTALLMELVAPAGSGTVPALLEAVAGAARAAGCRRLGFFATPGFPHWTALRAHGFAPRAAHRHLFVDRAACEEPPRLEDWQLAPGDADDE